MSSGRPGTTQALRRPPPFLSPFSRTGLTLVIPCGRRTKAGSQLASSGKRTLPPFWRPDSEVRGSAGPCPRKASREDPSCLSRLLWLQGSVALWLCLSRLCLCPHRASSSVCLRICLSRPPLPHSQSAPAIGLGAHEGDQGKSSMPCPSLNYTRAGPLQGLGVRMPRALGGLPPARGS